MDTHTVCALIGAAFYNAEFGHLAKATLQTREALTICEHPQDTYLHAQCHHTLAQFSERTGSPEEAITVVLNTKGLHSKEGDQFAAPQCYVTLPAVPQRNADLDGVKRSLIAAAKIMHRLEKKLDPATVTRSLSPVYKE
jgi:hypothetical protein